MFGGLLLVGLLASLLAGVTPATEPAAATPPAPAAVNSVLYFEGFDGPYLNEGSTGWSVSTGPAFGYGTKSQAYMLRANLYIADGMLHFVTRRHCVFSGQAPSPSNERAEPCQNVGKTTAYSAARVDGNYKTPYGANWEIRIRALLPGHLERGVRAALWSRNRSGSCSNNGPGAAIYYGEVDVLEWYANNPNTGHSVTHLGCSGTSTIWQDRPSTMNPDHQNWLEWIATRQGNTVSYSLGSPTLGYYPIGSSTCGNAPFVSFPAGACEAILNDPFNVILQTEVFHPNSGFVSPNPNERFDRNTLKVDWVQITQLP